MLLLLLLAPLSCFATGTPGTSSYPPQFGCNANDTFAGRQPFYNPGLNHLTLAMCPRSALSSGDSANATCTPSQLIPCTDVTGPGTTRFTATASAEWLLNIPAQAAYLVLSYCSPQPFSWHCLVTTPPVTLVPVDSETPYLVPYPTNTTQFCDTAEDCDGGAPCLLSPTPPRCGAPASPSPSPSLQPVPTPSAGPAALTCNLTGTYLQFCPTCRGLLGSSFRPQASINMTSAGAGGTFTFSCRSDPQVGFCPLNAHLLNGTGQLAASGNTFTLHTLNGSQPFTIAGVINSTFSCSTLTLLSYTRGTLGGPPTPIVWPVVWDANPPSTPPVLDLRVAGASFLGTSASAQLVATGVAIVAAAPGGGAALIAVAGNGQANPGALDPVLLLGAGASANGSVLVLRAQDPSVRGSGLLPAALLKLGDRVDHIRANAHGDVVVAGSFGIAVLTGLGSSGTISSSPSPSASPKVLWHDTLADMEQGTCGVCCSGTFTCRVDLGDDGVVVAAYAVESGEGWLWGAYSASGTRFLQRAQPAAQLTSVLVNAATRQLGVAWIYVSNTGREPMIMPRLAMLSYAAAPTLAPDWTALPWNATVYREPGPCNGNVADGRVEDARFGRNGRLLFSGRSDGGNSPFYCGLRNVSRVTPMGVIDDYTTPYDMQSQAITNMLQLDAASGEVIVGQVQLVRVGPRGGGNTLLTLAAQTDEAGVLYQLQAAAFCLPNMGNLTINGIPTAAPSDASALLVLDSNMRRRLHWTDFAAAGSASGGGGGGFPVDLDVRGSVVALALNANGGMVTDGALPGTVGTSATGAPVAYVVVMPTVSA